MGLAAFMVIALETSMKAAPSTISSRYIRMTSLSGSFSRYLRRSISLMSALFPMLTNLEKPMLRPAA